MRFLKNLMILVDTTIILLLFLFLDGLDISHGYILVLDRPSVIRHCHQSLCPRNALDRLRRRCSGTLIAHSVVVDGSEDKDTPVATKEIEQATDVLSEWDKLYNTKDTYSEDMEKRRSELRPLLAEATMVLNTAARLERQRQVDLGRCMLGICASSTAEGIATLKAWVTTLQLPRGLLHGMDVDGNPVVIDGGVYIKYNSGGVYTFADIRKSQMGFDALWKPGDAMLEQYEGEYRGVYFQVELSDGVFRQFLLPLDTFQN